MINVNVRIIPELRQKVVHKGNKEKHFQEERLSAGRNGKFIFENLL